MAAIPVIAIFDIGKSNKKLVCFDRDYQMVLERSVRLGEIPDTDGFPSEDPALVQDFLFSSLEQLRQEGALEVQAVNFSAYGASLVGLDGAGRAIRPIYNYLKPYPAGIAESFFAAYGGKELLTRKTASPFLGSLNSGLQILRIRMEIPDLFRQVRYFMHLPQWLASLVTGQFSSGLTSIGCHTLLWDFSSGRYHDWVEKEQIMEKLAPLLPETRAVPVRLGATGLVAGTGIQDSSAALIPYLLTFREPFILVSTGTWSISLNPFNDELLTGIELEQDCLCYLRTDGAAVKASRFLLGPVYESSLKRIADYFKVDLGIFASMSFNAEWANRDLPGEEIQPEKFTSAGHAYHQLIQGIVHKQERSIRLVLGKVTPTHIFVDGGFSRNLVFLHLLSKCFPEIRVQASATGQASALGAALTIHSSWNPGPVPDHLAIVRDFS
ncbi:MAG TPA: FGGY family carbohydrate kinase [Chitinophagaceae bacterium]|nr:FGGY family carbohydrate kinase [Chitinophagaceae bacterium]